MSKKEAIKVFEDRKVRTLWVTISFDVPWARTCVTCGIVFSQNVNLI